MIELLTIVSPYIGIGGVAVATLATMAVVGIAFLTAPSRATLYWSIAFVLGMVCCCAAAAADANGAELARRIAVGCLLGVPALIWSGFRALRGVRSFVWIGAALAVAASCTLALVSDPVLYAQISPVVFFIGSLFGGLLVLEWIAIPRPRDPLLIPLLVASAFLLATGISNLVISLTQEPFEDLPVLRLSAGLVLVALLACAAIGIVAMCAGARLRSLRSRGSREWERYASGASEHLAAAQTTGEPWSILYVQLDDATDIRRAVGSAAVDRLSASVEGSIRAVLPADALISVIAPGTMVAATSHDDAAMLDLLRTAQQRVSNIIVDGRMPIQPSVSIGWAQTSNVGYDFETLVYFAREASSVARENGGDRWERVSSRVAERLLSPQSLR